MIVLLSDVALADRLSRAQAILLRHLIDTLRPCTTQDLAEVLWGHRSDGGGANSTIWTHIMHIRMKLLPGFGIWHHRGFGYRLSGADT